MKKIAFVTLIGLCLFAKPIRAAINLLHEFAGGASDGAEPRGSLIVSGSTLYGITRLGGDKNRGTVFKIQNNGIDFTLLHEFAGGAIDGETPCGSLVISGATIYGMTRLGGDMNRGTIFKMQNNGSDFTLLHEFTGGASDGAEPRGSLIISGSTIYGMTRQGGDKNRGTVFKIQNNGKGFILLHEFAGGTNDGADPKGSLILSGAVLFGMTEWGGYNNDGTIFKIRTDGTSFALLHEFAAGNADGFAPCGDLLISGSTLYGMTRVFGTIFKMQIDGTDFTLLHEFTGGAADGENPVGSLILSGSTLYGMTESGGGSDKGTIFKMQTDGSGFSLLHEFAGGVADGSYPDGSLIVSGSNLFGMASNGCASGYGVFFSLPIPLTSIDFIGTWDGEGVFYHDSLTSLRVKLATPAAMITAGDLDGDGIDDLIGIWPEQGGVWVKHSQSGAWAQLSGTAHDICVGDMNGDGWDDLLATWDGQGVYYRHSISGAWVQMATPAEQVTAGDLDGDNKDDLIGVWPEQGGVWVKYSQSGNWAKLSTTPIKIACADMNGDGRDDLVATWDTLGVFYRNSIGGAWVKLATPAMQVASGDLDGDSRADLIGIWPRQGVVWVKYSLSGSWAKLSATATDIAVGRMRSGSTLDLNPDMELFESAINYELGPVIGSNKLDLLASAPGRVDFICSKEKNMKPYELDRDRRQRIPGPGEAGFRCTEQENLEPHTSEKPEADPGRKLR